MSEPTQEQVKEFWEWCGLHYNKPSGGYFWDEEDNVVIDMHKGETGIDLNNLFKYAVPRLQRNGHLFTLCPTRFTGEFRVDIWCSGDVDIISTVDENPALALFWAIYQVLREQQDDPK